MTVQETRKPNDYVTHQEFQDFTHKIERSHDKLTNEMAILRKDMEIQGTVLNGKVDNLSLILDKKLACSNRNQIIGVVTIVAAILGLFFSSR
ncbi:hypothetical protein G6R29_04040 [Fructobacillus sp. M2-14]|uniref:t-SNARE coiled-coil homology domain-containing protein n=1 Tax=Fructobacillus broussonetiae TaxID=2713173 RepID=A0ABS5R021_9LACO|nr:hypothetical protein [Fructobacillus broussonetiae]MBS9338793.1 hypothetical protein [Fructobacillus broussonetiae]